MKKIVLVADLLALTCAALWFGSYQWWMFYAFLACVIVIETSCRYLCEHHMNRKDDPL